MVHFSSNWLKYSGKGGAIRITENLGLYLYSVFKIIYQGGGGVQTEYGLYRGLMKRIIK